MTTELTKKQKDRLALHDEIERHLSSGIMVKTKGHKTLDDDFYKVVSVSKFSGGELDGTYYFTVKVTHQKAIIMVGCNTIRETKIILDKNEEEVTSTKEKPKPTVIKTTRLDSLKSSLYTSDFYSAKQVKKEEPITTPEPVTETEQPIKKKGFLKRLFRK